MARYKLTRLAAEDLEQLLDYGIDRYGIDQACEYYDGLKQRLDNIASNPEHYPAVEHIHQSYRRSVFGIHSVYYTANNNEIVIIRILGRQDIQTNLTPP